MQSAVPLDGFDESTGDTLDDLYGNHADVTLTGVCLFIHGKDFTPAKYTAEANI
jgi:hypothetical protein